MKRVAALGVAALVTAACGIAPPDPPSSPRSAASPSPSGTPPGRQSVSPTAFSPTATIAVTDLRLTCGGPLTFTADDLLAPSGAETADHPAAEVLRTLMETSPLPNRNGWRLVAMSDEEAVFILPALPGEGFAYWYAEVEAAGSTWQSGPFGQCDPMPRLEGLSPARWELAADADMGPESRVVRVLVFELACASGRSPEGRIAPAAVIYGEDSVTILFGTRPLAGGAQTCQAGPPAEVSVDLREPIGNRVLLDGSVFPAEPRGEAAP